MEKEYFISIYLDTRRPKSSGKFPVKLRIFTSNPRRQKLYSTIFDFTKKEFESIWETKKPRKEYQDNRNKLQELELRAYEICENTKPFSFSQFEKKYLRKTGDGNDVIYQYNQKIDKLKSNNNFSTAGNYEMSLKSLLRFIEHSKGKQATQLNFADITPDWLQKYETYMIEHLQRSRTTVSMYLRALRTIFNIVISEKEIDSEIYPFGKNKYQPPAQRNVKKALNKEQLKKLFEAKPITQEQAKAKDFWFFSFACNGMNIKDIALLKYENIQEDKIIFYRAKTINSSKSDLHPVTVYLNEFAQSIIKKYGVPNRKKNEYVFPIISSDKTNFENHRSIKNFTIFINKNLQKLVKSAGITQDISTYWARHSFATTLIRNGASMELVMEQLAHSNMKTTINYFAGFEDEVKKEFGKNIMKF